MPDIYKALQSLSKMDKQFASEIDPDGFWSRAGVDRPKWSLKDSDEAVVKKVIQSMDAVYSTKAKAAAVIRAMVDHFSFYDGEYDVVDVSDLLGVAERLDGRQL